MNLEHLDKIVFENSIDDPVALMNPFPDILLTPLRDHSPQARPLWHALDQIPQTVSQGCGLDGVTLCKELDRLAIVFGSLG